MERQVAYQEEALHQRAVGVQQAARGRGYGPQLPEFKEHLEDTFRHMV